MICLLIVIINCTKLPVIAGEYVYSFHIPALSDTLLPEIEKAVQLLEGVVDVYPDLGRKRLVITFDDDQTGLEQLLTVLQRNGVVLQTVRLLQEPHGDIM